MRSASSSAGDEATASFDLSWDDDVGWEPRHVFGPGEVSYTRPEGSRVELEYVLGPQFEAIVARGGGVAVRDKPLIARHPEELCHASLAEAVAHLAPDRLLVHIDADLDVPARDCLANLAVPNLYLSICPHDGAYGSMNHCRDGDASLTLIAASDELRDKVRGLAIGFGEEHSWATLSRFSRLEQLVVRGAALNHVDMRGAFGLCDLQELRYVDALNAHVPGAEFPRIPPQCILGWSVFNAWTLDPLRPWLDQPTAPWGVPCQLERVFVDRVDEPDRRTLEEQCPKLRELDVMEPTEQCRRAGEGDAFVCTAL